MEVQRREFGTRPRQHWLAIAVAPCVASGIGFVVGNRAWTRAPTDSIPLSFLQRSVPVWLEIEFTGKSTEIGKWTGGEPFRGAEGVARYTFTNWTSARVTLAFPPARSFHFNRGSIQIGDALPAFASKTLLLHLAPGESQSFSEPYSVAPAGDDFWRGGSGFYAFVFDAPSAGLRPLCSPA